MAYNGSTVFFYTPNYTQTTQLTQTDHPCILCEVKPLRRFSCKLSSILAFLLPVLLYAIYANACIAAPQIDLSAIAQIESSSNSSAVGDGGKALGLFQLHKGVFEDYSKAKGCVIAHSMALDGPTSLEVASWYLRSRIPQILRSLKKPVTEENIIRCYNAGCGSLKRRPSPTTQAYLSKYRRLTHGKAKGRRTATVDYRGLLRGIQRGGSTLRPEPCTAGSGQ